MASEYPPIADYALISDCRAAALVSRGGSIDWCCLPRFDAGSYFARMLDAERGGFCSIRPAGESSRGGRVTFRNYVEESLVLETIFRTAGGQARVLDYFTSLPGLEASSEVDGERDAPRPEIVRIVEGQRGSFEFELVVEPRFDYGAIAAWIRHHGMGVFSAIGGDDGLLIRSDLPLRTEGRHRLAGQGIVRPGERARLALTFVPPAELDPEPREGKDEEIDAFDARVDAAIELWREWARTTRLKGPDAPGASRSALVLKGLTYAPTGAIVAAATTSLPESWDGERNWDYRFSWIRDSALAVRTLARLGFEDEADGFRRFIERSAAGNAQDLQVVYGVGGERRLLESELDHLEGYRGIGPVRVGNRAIDQLQLDAFGQLLDQSWRWYERGHEPDDDYWRFLVELVEAAAERWREPDNGIWEWPGGRRHFVHSKVHCWAALHRGLMLAERCMRKAPERRWRRARDEIREAVESEGYDAERGVFTQCFGEPDLDAALLRLPSVEFVAYDDDRMVRTVDAIREELTVDGLLRRYTTHDGIGTPEAAFVPCTFWLAECLARQGRLDEARETFDCAIATSNGLGLFSEEYDPERSEMAGNFPQALSHLAHLEAVLALAEMQVPAATPTAADTAG